MVDSSSGGAGHCEMVKEVTRASSGAVAMSIGVIQRVDFYGELWLLHGGVVGNGWSSGTKYQLQPIPTYNHY